MMSPSLTRPWRTADTFLFVGTLILAFVLRLGCAILFRNVNHTDEIFQYMEPAHRLVFGYGLVTWEFREGGRSFLVPAAIAAIMKAAAAFSNDPSAYLEAIGIVM